MEDRECSWSPYLQDKFLEALEGALWFHQFA